ncbi:MAG: hypothetical protein HY054_12105 [Proteobacteria bacterium]|nr:hypothetical protein [Pseudomonadota bacterium]
MASARLAALFYNDSGLRQLVVVAGAVVFALALATLGAAWMLRRPPKTRRTVVMHVVIAGAIASCIAPLVVTPLLGAAAANFTLPMAMTMLPLAIVIGLPVALVSGIAFTWIALKRQSPSEPHDLLNAGLVHSDVQPFR